MEFKRYEEAGKILNSVMDRIKVREGMDALQLAEEIEGRIVELGGKPAFPCNISFNNEAAHNTPAPGERKPLEGVVKVDFGVHRDGYIVDAAKTFDLSGEYGKLVEVAEEALREALSVIRDGVEVRKVGEVVDAVARKYGYRPVENLGGHSLERWRLHGGLFIPNVPKGGGILKEGMVIAVEPFISKGEGRVVDGSRVEIFQISDKRSRNPRIREISNKLRETFGELPFARRWVEKVGISSQWIRFMLIEGSIKGYPVLIDRKGVVAQAEATVIVEKDGVKVIAGDI